MPKPVNAWQWDGTHESMLAIADALGKKLRLLALLDDPKDVFLEMPFGCPEWFARPQDWIVRTWNGQLRVIEPDLFETIRETALPVPDIQGVPV